MVHGPRQRRVPVCRVAAAPVTVISVTRRPRPAAEGSPDPARGVAPPIRPRLRPSRPARQDPPLSLGSALANQAPPHPAKTRLCHQVPPTPSKPGPRPSGPAHFLQTWLPPARLRPLPPSRAPARQAPPTPARPRPVASLPWCRPPPSPSPGRWSRLRRSHRPSPAATAAAKMSAGGSVGSSSASGSNRRLQQTQNQVDEVVDIMRVNVDKVLERDQKLSELDDRADALQAGASQFETSAAKLKRKYWWKNCKMWAIGITVIVVIIIIIIVWSFS
ncbi:vesicle-associated membrane protein 3 [Tamandua tetradactyla]|uniref:vesicle-associated membrane protein 3 n=1 Tax=Tamandua tetradactyla TaxID=48850 RepID=UPI00405412FB